MLLIEGLRWKTDLAPIIAHLKAALDGPFRVDAREVSVRVSLGVTFFPLNARHAERLVDQADRAMYVAKGRSADDEDGWVRLYDTDMPPDPNASLGLRDEADD